MCASGYLTNRFSTLLHDVTTWGFPVTSVSDEGSSVVIVNHDRRSPSNTTNLFCKLWRSSFSKKGLITSTLRFPFLCVLSCEWLLKQKENSRYQKFQTFILTLFSYWNTKRGLPSWGTNNPVLWRLHGRVLHVCFLSSTLVSRGMKGGKRWRETD